MMPQFTVMDTVQVTHDQAARYGERGTVIEIRPYRVWVLFSDGAKAALPDDWLEHVPYRFA